MDDYLIKPFNPAELAARVKSQIHIHKLLLEEENIKGQELEQEISYGSLPILL